MTDTDVPATSAPRRRHRRLTTFAVGAVALVTSVALSPLANAPAAPADPVLPDLVADPVEGPYLSLYTSGGSQRLLLRFDGFLHNVGAGALEMRRDNGSTVQRVYKESGAIDRDDPSRSATIVFEDADGHDHWHLKDAARYSLWNAGRSAEVAPAQKVGFCLEDSDRVSGSVLRRYSDNAVAFCKAGQPTATSVFEGISPGWRDVYGDYLTFQWVDASDVQPGAYWLKSEMDPQNVIIESDESNPGAFAASSSVIPGYVAAAVAAGSTPAGATKAVALDAQRFGSPGARRFEIVDPPDHGSLDVAAGSSFAASSVTYTPAPGYTGPDEFRYVALDSTSGFPRNPAAAPVSLSVGGGTPAASVAIGGAPASLIAGTSAQLGATVTGAPAGVTWTVDGVGGGSAAVGNVSASGLYTAPSAVPPAGSVTIGARTASGATDQVTIRILPVPPRDPAPLPPPGSGAAAGPSKAVVKSPLAAPRLARLGHSLVISSRASRAGIATVRAKKRGRTLGSCRTRVAKNRSFTCRIRLRKGVSTRGIEVSVSLRVGRSLKLVAVRRSSYDKVDRAARAAQSGLVCWIGAAR